MCMKRGIRETSGLIKKHKDKKEIIVWKVYLIGTYTGDVMPPFFYGSRAGGAVKSGTIKSNRPCQPKRVWDGMSIYRGIHVFLNRERARDAAYGNRRVFKCTAKIEDLIGVGFYCDQAAFMQIHITPEEFEKGKKGRN